MATYDLAYPGAAIDAILNTAYYLQEAGYIFRGSASDYAGTPSKREWVIAPAGFTGFGITSPVPKGSIGVCLYNGTAWVGKIINVVSIDSSVSGSSTNPVSGSAVYEAINQLATGVAEALDNLTFTDTTPTSFLGDYIKMKVSTTDGGVERILTFFTILAATTEKAGLMSAEDKAKVDSFLNNLRSLTFADTTASACQATQITETLKATIGGAQEVIDSITILAATSSKAGLLSAFDKAYIDALPSALTNLSNSISAALALMESLVGYYVCDTAAGTAAKTVAATGYTLTNGGCIRIKMTNANTATNVTLNINSTGAKALYYDGAQASSTNTWEAGEVLEVYYDGTQYQCASGGGGSADRIKYDNSVSGINADNVQEAIDVEAGNITELQDVLIPKQHIVLGGDTTASSNLDKSSVWFYFNYAVSVGQRIDSIELPANYTGEFILAFANSSTQKVTAVNRYTVANSNIIPINKTIEEPCILGFGAAATQILKYGSVNTGTVKYVAVNSIVVNSGLVGSYQRGDANLKVNISVSLTPLDEKVVELEAKDDEMEADINILNNTLYPTEITRYGDLASNTGDLNKSSVWFYFNYTVSAGQVIETIELPANYTGEFILAIANSGTQKVTEVNRYTVSGSNIVTLNKTIQDSGILGFGCAASQILKYGSGNTGTVKYVAVNSIVVNSGLAGSYQRGDINLKVNIKRTLPSFEDRLSALEQEGIENAYGDINIIPVHGQSLSLGILNSIPAIPAHKLPILGGLMFNTGIYQVNSGLDKMQGIKVLEEGSSTIYGDPDYETSCWGTAEMVKKRIIDKLGNNVQTFYLTCGQDGSGIDEQFDSELQVLERAMLRVKELLPYKTVKIPCFCYVQGEADQAAGMATETYKSKLKAGREAIQGIAERVLGQTTPVQCILYQTIRGYYDHKTITQAQMELCRDDENFAPSTSVYTLIQTPKNDRLHISNWGQYLLGQYQGIQFADWIYFGRKNVGVIPLDITVSSNVVIIKFKVSYPPLRFVTDWVTAVDNYGFSIVHSGTNIIAQDGVVIVDADKVQITCTQNIQNGDMLYYGISLDTSSASAGEGGDHRRGSRGNLCDSQGELYTTQVVNDADNQLTTVALNNYCYSFYEELIV